MAILPNTAENLARIGVNLEITPEAKYLPNTVENLVRIVKGNDAHITIHAGSYLPNTLENFARIGGKPGRGRIAPHFGA